MNFKSNSMIERDHSSSKEYKTPTANQQWIEYQFQSDLKSLTTKAYFRKFQNILSQIEANTIKID